MNYNVTAECIYVFYVEYNLGEYNQNLCHGKPGCILCPKRLPSCVGKPDGNQPFPSKQWMEDYVKCYKNRTMSVVKCPKGQYFHPNEQKCKTKVDKGKPLLILYPYFELLMKKKG